MSCIPIELGGRVDSMLWELKLMGLWLKYIRECSRGIGIDLRRTGVPQAEDVALTWDIG